MPALAGGDNLDAAGNPSKTPTYYANSPSGMLPAADCFNITPPASGAFDTSKPYAPQDGVVTNISCDSGTALRKFVDPLASIPFAIPDKTTYPGSDYYEIAVVEYTQKMHTDLVKATKLRGYVQLATSVVPGAGISLGANLPSGSAATAVAKPTYLGPIIHATQGRPTRVKLYNLLPAGTTGNLPLPVDETIAGAGFGPDGQTKYLQNRVMMHLHGGDNPWISDGTPHQWILPAADEIALKNAGKPEMARGASTKNVPDMPDPGPGAATYYYPNGLSGRLEWYHDHSEAITRLNVYAGMAAGYLVSDLPGVGENHPALSGLLPIDQIPLIIQDKTFVPKDIAMQDAKWDTALGQEGDLWYPHVYETNQDPNSWDGTNPVGRWDWGSWFWPVFPSVYDLPTGEVKAINAITKLGEASTTPEAYMDTPVINGVAYPTLEVQPKAYRFRILNGANDRFINLGLYLAADKKTTNPDTPTQSDNTVLCDGKTTRPSGTIDATTGRDIGASPLLTTDCTEVKMVPFGSGYKPPQDAAYTIDGHTAFPTTGGITGTGWGTQVDGLFPQGAPDPATAGPHIVQIGNEAGLLVSPLDIPSTPLNFEYNKRSVTVLNVQERGLFMGPAERADAIIDFSNYAGKTLIVYNDAPAPTPASDPRIDYYSGNGDQTGEGGAPNTKPGYGPNTRTIMQIHVAAGAGTAGPSITSLNGALPQAYASAQPMPVIPEPIYNPAFGATAGYAAVSPAGRYNARIYTGTVYLGAYNSININTPSSITYTPAPTCTTSAKCATALAAQRAKANNGLVTAAAGAPIKAYVENKAIQELFDPTYGRMNATLGIELPFTNVMNATTIPLGFLDPTTETVADGETQFWKITHNGVDSHPVHFHLVNVQVINRIGWDGTVKVPYGDEAGWKETVKMHPLEDIVVAVRAKKPTLTGITGKNGFGLPNSVRLMDPTQKIGSLLGFTQIDATTGNPSVVANAMQNYGWEYAWHCHILGHEENDFMRPIKFNANELTPSAPSNLVDVNNGSVLTWTDNAATEYAYKVERAAIGPQQTCTPRRGVPSCVTTTGPGTYTDISGLVIPADQQVGKAPLANAESFTDTATLDGSVAYSYRVTAIGVAGSASATVVRPIVGTPIAPVLAASGTTTTATTLTWTESSTTVTAFAIYQVGNATPVATVNYPTMTYTVNGLTPGASYQYYVVAQNNALVSPNSNTISVTTPSASAIAFTIPAGVNAITPPSNVAIQRTSATAATLSWVDASTNETSFQPQTSIDNGSTWVDIGAAITRTAANTTATGGALSATMTVSNSTNALYRVNAINNVTPTSAFSSSVLLNDVALPAAPSGFTATATQVSMFIFKINTITLAWTDVANNNVSYNIRRATDAAYSANVTNSTATANATGATQSLLATNTPYYFEIQAVNSAGTSAWVTVSATTKP